MTYPKNLTKSIGPQISNQIDWVLETIYVKVIGNIIFMKFYENVQKHFVDVELCARIQLLLLYYILWGLHLTY